MIFDIVELSRKYNLKIKGTIVIGAFYGLNEEKAFAQLGIKNLAFFEPLEWSFAVLRNNFTGKYPIYQYALGNENRKVIMNCEVDNGSMSSSILVPKKHLEYYPYIHFTEELKREVEMIRLDDFNDLDFDKYNALNIDVQGYELEVLKGAKYVVETFIDYIFCEVNREELYENCARIEQVDQFLNEFARVETCWTPYGFGDALYIRNNI